MTQSKKGISSIELGRRLGVTQTTAWKIKQKLMQIIIFDAEANCRRSLGGARPYDQPHVMSRLKSPQAVAERSVFIYGIYR